jgi:hypothetical protein
MNAQSPHLELDELLAEPVSEQARAHLAICPDCRGEARRWGTVAAGVRGHEAMTPELPPLSPPQRTGRRIRLITSAAAALVLLGGAGYGVNAALAGHASSPASSAKTAALVHVNGCAALVQATGTLQQQNGTSLVIQTSGGQSLTVTTTSSTLVSQLDGSLSDVTDGAPVRVAGTESNGTLAAVKVAVGLPDVKQKPKPPGTQGSQTAHTPPGTTVVQGTVANVTTGGFTVVESSGTQLPVTASSQTHIAVLRASLSDLQTGGSIIVVGFAGSDGTLSAAVVAQIPPGKQSMLLASNCSPASIDSAITTAQVSSG